MHYAKFALEEMVYYFPTYLLWNLCIFYSSDHTTLASRAYLALIHLPFVYGCLNSIKAEVRM